MSAVTLTQIMTGIQGRLNTIAGLNTSDVVADSIMVPFAVVGVPDIPNYRASFGRGSWMPQPTITVYVSKAHTVTGQLALASYADVTGAASIPAAIEADRTLGGLSGVDCIVTSFRTLGAEEVANLDYYGGLFGLQVIAAGT